MRQAAVNLARELGSVAVAVLAWMTCAGMPALLAALGALGAGGLAAHSFMFPAFAAFLGFSVWLLWRSGRARNDLRPFWLGLVSAVFATVTTWVGIVGIAGWSGWWSYLGITGVVGASVWSYVLGRRPGSCLKEMIFEVRQRERRGTLAHRFAMNGLLLVVTGAALYGLHRSITAFGIG